MRYETSIAIDAPAATVWEIYRDVVRWPEWTPSITEVVRLDPGPFRVGSRARVIQPGLPPAEWTVTEMTSGPTEHSFVWVSTAPGLRTVGIHIVRATDGGCVATAAIEQHGPLGAVIGLVYRQLTRRYLDWETRGLKTLAETAG